MQIETVNFLLFTSITFKVASALAAATKFLDKERCVKAQNDT